MLSSGPRWPRALVGSWPLAQSAGTLALAGPCWPGPRQLALGHIDWLYKVVQSACWLPQHLLLLLLLCLLLLLIPGFIHRYFLSKCCTFSLPIERSETNLPYSLQLSIFPLLSYLILHFPDNLCIWDKAVTRQFGDIALISLNLSFLIIAVDSYHGINAVI